MLAVVPFTEFQTRELAGLKYLSVESVFILLQRGNFGVLVCPEHDLYCLLQMVIYLKAYTTSKALTTFLSKFVGVYEFFYYFLFHLRLNSPSKFNSHSRIRSLTDCGGILSASLSSNG